MRNYLFVLLFAFLAYTNASTQIYYNCNHSVSKEEQKEMVKLLDSHRSEVRVATCTDNLVWNGGDQTYRVILEYSKVYHSMDDIMTSLVPDIKALYNAHGIDFEFILLKISTTVLTQTVLIGY
jgi:hypothetical protein